MFNNNGINLIGSTPSPQPFKLNKTTPPDTTSTENKTTPESPTPTEQTQLSEQGSALTAVALHEDSNLWHKPEEKNSLRLQKPTTVYVGVGFPSGVHVGVNHSLNQKFAVGGEIGSMGIMNDYSVHGRYYFAELPHDNPNQSFELYTETGAHLMERHFQASGNKCAGALSQTIGVEARNREGMTIHGGVGLSASTAGQVTPTVGFGLGYSF